jgi:hypothetical protein
VAAAGFAVQESAHAETPEQIEAGKYGTN